MKFRFAHKLLLVILVPLVIGQFGTLYGVMRVAQQEVRDTAGETLRLGANVAREYLQSRTEERQQTVEVLAADFALKEVLAFSDSGSIRSALDNHGQRLGADFGAFISSEEITPVVTHDALANEILDYVPSADDGELILPPISSIALDSKVYQVFSAPVKAPTTIGYLVYGFSVGDDVVERIEELTGLEAGLFRVGADGLEDLSTSGYSGLSWIQPDFASRQVYSVQDGGQSYLGVYTPLAHGDQETVVVLRKSLEEAMAPYYSARVSLLLFGLGILCLVGLIGLWFSRSIAKPVADLSDAVEQVAQGSYTAKLTVSRQDEFGRLADAFRKMQSAIAERQSKILHQNHHDDLTGLPNRKRLVAVMTDEQSMDPAAKVTLMAVRLSGMQAISSSIGQAATDALIVRVTKLIQGCLPDNAALYHTGTHELFVTIPEVDLAAAEKIALQLAKLIGQGVSSDRQSIQIKTYWGISHSPEHGADASNLIRFAQVAATDAFARNEAVEIYEADREQVFERQLKIVSDLPSAVRARELTVVFQPKINLADGSIHGAEALIRWTHKDLGFLPPDEFIPLLEQSGTIEQLTRFVITEAIEKLAVLHGKGYSLCMGINLSTRDLLDEGLVAFVVQTLETNGISPQYLILEVTETSIMEHVDRAIATLERLRSVGITIAIDDFGTGQSSLAQLQKLPIDELKVDKGFVIPMSTDPTCDLLVSTTITLAHQMGLKVVAEGVEDEHSARRLCGFGCEVGQGYHFSKPLPLDEFVEWIAEYQPVPFEERRQSDRPFSHQAG